ncbi:hypothetical protein J7T55_006556 [Diaporthe amygdali]|uniref:uncharacterized protein n=1 Tax=Phomopsis amygdali TaxID=1214568 RepID=UPI0022FF17A7|nr:uncharacterized protein J7T55_006556 [Diaporthe amygdali]KAJ0125211.1 hypothetical protein J7T55_006556 [Diaporthe amygdali]
MDHQPLYSPLDPSTRQIRLLQVSCTEVDEDFAPVICRLVTASLDDPSIRYIALSYVWGFETSQTPLVVDGKECNITANLFEFLVRYRKISYVVPQWELANFPVWIDAVCINQEDIPERNSQVQMMGSIYRSATRTISWLGPDSVGSESAMKVMRRIWPKVNDSMRKQDLLAWLSSEDMSLWQKDTQSANRTGFSTGNEFWDSWKDIFSRAYFSRSWITQELVLSRNVVVLCGQQTLPLAAFLVIWEWLLRIEGTSCPEQVDSNIWSFLSSREGRRLLGWGAMNKWPNLRELMTRSKDAREEHLLLIWHELVLHTRILQATDPRDKLYSVLGMVDRKFKPDYSASIEDVFYDFAKEYIYAEKRLSVLREAGHGTFFGTPEHPRHRLFVPSWVPNWDALSKELTWGQFYHGSYRLSADLNLQQAIGPQFSELLEHEGRGYWKIVGRTLTALGLVCDSTVAVHRLGVDHESWGSFCESYVSNCGEHSQYVTGIPALQALARLIFLDQDPISRNDVDDSTLAKDMLRICILGIILMGSPAQSMVEKFGLTSQPSLVKKFLGSGELASNFLESGELAKDLVDISALRIHLPKLTSDRLSLVLNYVAFWTSDGYLGWGPPGMVAGDDVCVMVGCDVPVVLRRVGDHHIHIGPCWVLGLMNGEALDKAMNSQAGLSSFDIV